ncbi:MAG: cupredoxin domain-containing protein [Acidobacteriota bacterium]
MTMGVRAWGQAAAVAGVLAAAAPAGARQGAPADGPVVVEVVASRFAFEPARIEVTEGDRVRLIVTSADGVHGIEIKRFRAKKVVPRGGEAVTLDFTASAAGTFEILCSEYCGNGHDDMKGTLVVRARPKAR